MKCEFFRCVIITKSTCVATCMWSLQSLDQPWQLTKLCTVDGMGGARSLCSSVSSSLGKMRYVVRCSALLIMLIYLSQNIIEIDKSIYALWNLVCFSGLQASRRCPKGRSCNFLHVFRNPDNMFNSYHKGFDNSYR